MSGTGLPTRRWVERREPGSLVASRLTGDVGTVLKRTSLGIWIRWRIGVCEFVLFSECSSLTRPEWRRKVRVERVRHDPETPPWEQERIRAAIAEVREEKRRPGEFCDPRYARSVGAELEVAGGVA